MAFLEGTSLILLIAFLFYRSYLAALFMAPGMVWFYRQWQTSMIGKKKGIFLLEFKDYLQSLGAALNVGYSVENAMKESLKDLKIIYSLDARIIQELSYMIHQIQMNLPIEKVLEEWGERMEVEEVKSFVTVFTTAKRTGGDSIRIIQNASHNICDKIDVKREIETMMAAKKMEFKVMLGVPMFILFYMRISFPEFMDALYGNVLGIILMSFCLLIYGIAYMWGRSIVSIEI